MKIVLALVLGMVVMSYSPGRVMGSMSGQGSTSGADRASKCDSIPVQLRPKDQMSNYGILRSADNGKTWTKVVNDSGAIDSIIQDRSGQVMAGTLGALIGRDMHLGLLKSNDDGRTWMRTTSCPSGADLTDLRSIAFAPNETLIAAGGRGIFSSEDHGHTWTRMKEGLEEGAESNIQSLAVSSQSVFFAATYDGAIRLSNGGKWTRIGLNGVPLNTLLATSKGTLLAGSGGKGIYRSTNDGLTWKQILVTPGRNSVGSIVSDSQGRVYSIIADHGIYRSDDDGITWRKLQIPGKKPVAYALAADSRGEVFAAIGDCCPVQKVVLFRSADAAATWTNILEVPGGDAAIGAIAVTRTGSIIVGLTTVGD
jgi:photosystem II stability/assembly factor-like uncharacterized protein